MTFNHENNHFKLLRCSCLVPLSYWHLFTTNGSKPKFIFLCFLHGYDLHVHFFTNRKFNQKHLITHF
jgi:hypothetical protein